MRPAAAVPGLHRAACRDMPTTFQPHTCETDRDTKEQTTLLYRYVKLYCLHT